MKMHSILKIQDGIVKREGKTIIKGIQLNILENKNYILIAKNGSGKSSLMHAIFQLYSEQIEFNGVLSVNETEIEHSTINMFKNGIMFLDGNVPVIPGLSIIELWYTVYRKYSHTNMDIFSFEDYVFQLFQKHDLAIEKSLIYKTVGECSLGEKKLTEVLPILFLDLKLICLDEIDSGVDAMYKSVITKILNLKSIAKLIITHDEKFASMFEDNTVYTITNGELHER